MQTNLAHLHGYFHTPPGLRHHSNTQRMTQCHLSYASWAERWSSEVTATAKLAEKRAKNKKQKTKKQTGHTKTRGKH